MEAKAGLLVAILMAMLPCMNQARGDTGNDAQLGPPRDATTLQAWKMAALAGDAEKQERLAVLLLDPRASARKASRLEGAHFLLQAAASGRRDAMLRLADALDKGAYRFKQLPDAARCWSSGPKDFEARLACLRLTDFQDPRARVTCNHLRSMREGLPTGGTSGANMARLCIANHTPALLVPGPPPGKDAIERAHLYAQHGIALVVTGDVYEEAYEKYREEFNRIVVADIEAKHRRGYMEKLSNDIETQMSRRHRAGK